MLTKFQQRSKKAYKNSASFACEATAAIRTVASLTREKDVWNHYHKELESQAKKSLITVLKSSVLYACSQSLMFLCLALGFWYGGNLIKDGEVCYHETPIMGVYNANGKHSTT
jgi:ATP-binding cassette subfamily B (MDR/TAP) protein 1